MHEVKAHLDDEVHAGLKELSDATNTPMHSLISTAVTWWLPRMLALRRREKQRLHDARELQQWEDDGGAPAAD